VLSMEARMISSWATLSAAPGAPPAAAAALLSGREKEVEMEVLGSGPAVPPLAADDALLSASSS